METEPLQREGYMCDQCDHVLKNLKDLKIHKDSKHKQTVSLQTMQQCIFLL